jgi:hypothetical protein
MTIQAPMSSSVIAQPAPTQPVPTQSVLNSSVKTQAIYRSASSAVAASTSLESTSAQESVLPSSETSKQTESLNPGSSPRVVPISERLVAPSSCPLPQARPAAGAASTPAESPISASRQPASPLQVMPPRLPYRASHQAELLCLQAEADALFEKLQALQQEKQRRAECQGNDL